MFFVVEMWLNKGINASELFNDYCVVRRDRCGRFLKRFNENIMEEFDTAISKNLIMSIRQIDNQM